MELSTNHRVRIAQSTDWKDAVITLLEPRSPYQPWHYGTTEVQEGDAVVFVLNTDPPSVLADVARVGLDDDLRGAVFDRTLYRPNLMELWTLAKILDLESQVVRGWVLEGADAINVELLLEECRYCSGPESRFGHNTMASACTLLRFDGQCDGCGEDIDLTGADARDEIFVHTVDQYTRTETQSLYSGVRDWPAVLCRQCFWRMNGEGFVSFLDYKFALHPPCPVCGERRTRDTFYGMPSDHSNIPPWLNAGGCVPSSKEWFCGVCGYRW
jgi:hypothetical protein